MNTRIELLRWMRQTKIFKTSDIIGWGYRNYSNRSERNARDFAEQGLIRRLSKFELEVREIKSKEGYYIICEKEIQKYLSPSLF